MQIIHEKERKEHGKSGIEYRKKQNHNSGYVYYMKYPPSNTRVYRTLKLELPEGWRKDVNYAARGGCMHSSHSIGLYLQASDEALQEFLDKGDSKLPEFAYCNGPLHYKNSTVLLGDAIHTVKPYFGMGVNSCLEDVIILDNSMSERESLGAALSSYTATRAPCSRALVEMSRSYDRDVRNPINLVSFLLPLLLDNFFNSLAPSVFEKPELGLFQDERISYTGILERKKKDRILQVITISIFFIVAGKVFPGIISLL